MLKLRFLPFGSKIFEIITNEILKEKKFLKLIKFISVHIKGTSKFTFQNQQFEKKSLTNFKKIVLSKSLKCQFHHILTAAPCVTKIH